MNVNFYVYHPTDYEFPKALEIKIVGLFEIFQIVKAGIFLKNFKPTRTLLARTF